ncbi:MAG: hypothetical protein U0V72_14410 [Cytophagales bacterium]
MKKLFAVLTIAGLVALSSCGKKEEATTTDTTAVAAPADSSVAAPADSSAAPADTTAKADSAAKTPAAH